VLVKAKRLADYPSNPVALDTTSSNSNGNGQAEAWPPFVILDGGHSKESITEPTASRVGGIKVRLTTQPLLRGKPQPLASRAFLGQAIIME
jgi:hypothetical protein